MSNVTAVTPPQLFDAYYYAHGCGDPYGEGAEWAALFANISQHIVRDIQPQTVLDAGCALGFLVDHLRQQNVDAYGIDISDYAIQNAPAAAAPYCRVGSVTEPFDRRYDLIVCLEVLEHMTRADAEAAVANLCQHTDDILFSSSPTDYKEATHFHVQPPDYWAALFSQHGFFRDVDFDASFIAPWAVRVRRSNEPLHRIVRNYERKFWLLWQENHDLRQLARAMRAESAEQAPMPTDIAQVTAERDRLHALVHGYENGKFMRLMRWLKRQRTASSQS